MSEWKTHRHRTPSPGQDGNPPRTRGRPRPAIMTVDDDPEVSRAVARDLRRRYGEQHRIVRAESGEAALDALRRDEAAR